MKFIWAEEREPHNRQLIFTIDIKRPCDRLKLCAADSYTVYADGEFIAYGPERTAAGYARPREIAVSGVVRLEIRVLTHGVSCYECDFQPPYFAAELSLAGEVIYGSLDFECRINSQKIANMPRYSIQRGFVEGYDLTAEVGDVTEVYEVDAPILIEGHHDTADYRKIAFSPIRSGDFATFDSVMTPHWCARIGDPGEGEVDIMPFFERAVSEKYRSVLYSLPVMKTGFIELLIEAREDVEVAVVFYEIISGGKRIYRRAACNDYIYLKLPRGEHRIVTAEPYCMMYAEVVTSGDATVVPRLISYENCDTGTPELVADEKITAIFRAAENSFVQNAVDLFTDCPGRERAGWLCDSYFTAIAERLFRGNNDIERVFLENIILSRAPELPEGMLPMCFPSRHKNGRYIPNWAMWFVLELEDYLERTGDRELIDAARERALGVIRFFDRYKNEYGLLENLESWVFIEWSIANDASYVSGVNFPSNMLYARALIAAGRLYGMSELCEEGERIRRTVKELSYNGKFFADNATREGGRLVRRDDHISETCQYYALWMGLDCDKDFTERMIHEFGPKRTDAYAEVGRSNMFIGNYLRFFWLTDIGEYGRVLDECTDYFAKMAAETGTLWEHDRPTASCNHGFTSVAAVILLRCAVGYVTVKDGEAVLRPDFRAPSGTELSVKFNYR